RKRPATARRKSNRPDVTSAEKSRRSRERSVMPSQRTSTVAIAALLFTLISCPHPTNPPAPAPAPHPDVVGSMPAPMAQPNINGFNLPPPGQAPIFPTDIDGGAPTATIPEAAMFAWNEFIAA